MAEDTIQQTINKTAQETGKVNAAMANIEQANTNA